MSYKYEDYREQIFTDQGQRNFLKFRENVFDKLEYSGAVRMDKVLTSGDSWTLMSYMDRMLEIGELKELETNSHAQYRIFTRI